MQMWLQAKGRVRRREGRGHMRALWFSEDTKQRNIALAGEVVETTLHQMALKASEGKGGRIDVLLLEEPALTRSLWENEEEALHLHVGPLSVLKLKRSTEIA